eukprot:2027577-Prymnesium_polylepis.1
MPKDNDPIPPPFHPALGARYDVTHQKQAASHAREGRAVDLSCKGPRFDSRGAPAEFSLTE